MSENQERLTEDMEKAHVEGMRELLSEDQLQKALSELPTIEVDQNKKLEDFVPTCADILSAKDSHSGVPSICLKDAGHTGNHRNNQIVWKREE